MTCPCPISAPAAGARNSAAARPGVARIAACVVVSMLTLGAAEAADMPELDDSFLRGSFAPQLSPPSYMNWGGIYFGGTLGMSSATVDYSDSLSSLTSYILRDSILQNEVSGLHTMGRESRTHSNFGAFLGYNYQLSDPLIIGLEANYTRLDLESSAQDGLTRIIQNDSQAPSGHHYYYTTTVTGNASVRIKDFATLRARAGWEIGQFLPYAFGGLAIGRADYYRTATVSYTTEDKPDPTDPPTPPDPPPDFGPVSNTDTQSNGIAYGFAAGLGVDVSILPNVFLRAEWEYVQFAPIHDIQVNINTGRVGIGLKF